MEDIIFKILNCWYLPNEPKNLNTKSQAEYNKKVAKSIAENLSAYSPLKDALKN